MSHNDYSKYQYVVTAQGGFELSEALSLWKALFEDFKSFKKEVITNPSLEDFGNFVEECWDDIKPVTVQQALKIANVEVRRVYFNCIGVEKLFKALNPKLLNKQTIKKKRTKWDDSNNPIEYTFEDVYELYEIEGTKLFEKDRWGNTPNNVYAVRCWCTTTNREYWIYVSKEAALGDRWWANDNSDVPDAIRAIAWTIRVDVPKENIDKIYRQGDIIVVKIKDDAKKTESSYRSYHLDKEQYLNLMYSET